MQEIDLGAEFEQEAAPSVDLLEQLHEQLEAMIEQSQLVELLEGDLVKAKQLLHEQRTQTVPKLMAQIQSDHFTFRGYEIRVEDLVSGSLPKDPVAKQKAIAWLEAHDAGGLLKTEVSVAFGRGSVEQAQELFTELERDKKLAPTMVRSVHPQTLMAWARSKIADGEEIEPEVLGLYVGKIAKLKVLK